MRNISLQEFGQLLADYKPAPGGSEQGFRDFSAAHLHKNAKRFYAMLSLLEKYISPGCEIHDFGAFPGTFLYILRHFFPDDNLRLNAAGLLINDDFEVFMKTLSAEVVKVNFDPAYDGIWSGEIPSDYQLPAAVNPADIIIASEIAEHLINPRHLFRIAARSIKPGGVFLVTTPNIARIRDRVNLLLGVSPNTPLHEGLLHDKQTRWRAHIRIFTMSEICEFMTDSGFEVMATGYSDDLPWDDKHLLKKLIYKIPSFRHTQLVLGRKK
jgi:SAM-dependent methyltransferase